MASFFGLYFKPFSFLLTSACSCYSSQLSSLPVFFSFLFCVALSVQFFPVLQFNGPPLLLQNTTLKPALFFNLSALIPTLLPVKEIKHLKISLCKIKQKKDIRDSDVYEEGDYHWIYDRKRELAEKEQYEWKRALAKEGQYDWKRALAEEGENKGEQPNKKEIIIRINNVLTVKIIEKIEMLTRCKHPNVVSFLGFCDELKSETFLGFEVAFEATLEKYLNNDHTVSQENLNLSWEQRIRICIDIAQGLKYLHNMEDKPSISHFALHSANVILDKKLTAMISVVDLFDSDQNFTSFLQEHKRLGLPDDDIYFFGVLLFEILTGTSNYHHIKEVFASESESMTMLKDMTYHRIRDEVAEKSLDAFIKITRKCLTVGTPTERPTLEVVIKSLEEVFNIRVVNSNWFLLGISIEKLSLPKCVSILTVSTTHFLTPRYCYHRPWLGNDLWDSWTYKYQPGLDPNSLDFLAGSSIEGARVKEQFMIPSSVIVKATNDFYKTECIGYGAYGDVYKAELNLSDIPSRYGKKLRSRCNSSSMNTVAIKRLKFENAHKGKKLLNDELDCLCQCENPNIVTLLAYCEDDKEMLLVYEYASNGSLDDQLSTNKEISFRQWTQRLKICIDIAEGLEYLHSNTEAKSVIVHRDIKSANILLFKNMKAKIADFGLSKVHVGNESTINTMKIAGTPYYVDPAYEVTGKLKKESDIYSFGVVLFEMFSGKRAYEKTYMMQNARRRFKKKTLKKILDAELMDETSLHPSFNVSKVRPDQESLSVFSNIAYRCLSGSQHKRPTIQAVVQDLKKALQFQEKRLRTTKYSLEQIKRGTNNFSDDERIIEHEMLYKGTIDQEPDRPINVLLKRFTNQKNGFLEEFAFIFKHKHENILGLKGYSTEMDEKIIVYEDASKGCLNRYLNDTNFSWTQRLKVCIDIASGLKFLHEGDVGQDVVIHGDLKSSNILLTIDWKAKIYGFKHALNDVAGLSGNNTNDLTKEYEIYSFGLVLFEIMSGREESPKENSEEGYLITKVRSYNERGRLEELVFEELKKHILQKSFAVFRRIALKCLGNSKERPRAGDVLEELQKALKTQEDYEGRKAKLNRVYKKILNKVPKSDKVSIYNILSEEVLHEDDKVVLTSFSFAFHNSFYIFK
ncbi:hypothetical protein R6Q59_023385 [Mikania micrantha]